MSSATPWCLTCALLRCVVLWTLAFNWPRPTIQSWFLQNYLPSSFPSSPVSPTLTHDYDSNLMLAEASNRAPRDSLLQCLP